MTRGQVFNIFNFFTRGVNPPLIFTISPAAQFTAPFSAAPAAPHIDVRCGTNEHVCHFGESAHTRDVSQHPLLAPRLGTTKG